MGVRRTSVSEEPIRLIPTNDRPKRAERAHKIVVCFSRNFMKKQSLVSVKVAEKILFKLHEKDIFENGTAVPLRRSRNTVETTKSSRHSLVFSWQFQRMIVRKFVLDLQDELVWDNLLTVFTFIRTVGIVVLFVVFPEIKLNTSSAAAH